MRIDESHIGKKVKHPGKDMSFDVMWIGKSHFRDHRGCEWKRDADWELVEDENPEKKPSERLHYSDEDVSIVAVILDEHHDRLKRLEERQK